MWCLLVVLGDAVVGVTCPDRLGEVKRNRFGQAFRYAAEQIQVGREGGA